MFWINLYCEIFFYLNYHRRHHVVFISMDWTVSIIIKNFYIFFLTSIRMSGKGINFDDKEINKSSFYKKKDYSA